MQSSLGFAGTALLGPEFGAKGDEKNSTGIHTKPASYTMNKFAGSDSQYDAVLFDDDPRTRQSLKVHRLLDQAQRVIKKEKKK